MLNTCCIFLNFLLLPMAYCGGIRSYKNCLLLLNNRIVEIWIKMSNNNVIRMRFAVPSERSGRMCQPYFERTHACVNVRRNTLRIFGIVCVLPKYGWYILQPLSTDIYRYGRAHSCNRKHMVLCLLKMETQTKSRSVNVIFCFYVCWKIKCEQSINSLLDYMCYWNLVFWFFLFYLDFYVNENTS